MAANSRPLPDLIPYRDQIPPSASTADLQRYLLERAREDKRWRDSLKPLLAPSSSGPSVPGSGGGGGGGTTIEQQREYVYEFNNENAGMVLVGRGNTAKWRLWIDDTIPDEPIINLENGATEIAGDVRFSSSVSGPVVRGTYNGRAHRFYVGDVEADAPYYAIERIAALEVNSGDLEFTIPGVSWMNRGRPNRHWWLVYVDDTAEDAVIEVERYAP